MTYRYRGRTIMIRFFSGMWQGFVDLPRGKVATKFFDEMTSAKRAAEALVDKEGI